MSPHPRIFSTRHVIPEINQTLGVRFLHNGCSCGGMQDASGRQSGSVIFLYRQLAWEINLRFTHETDDVYI